MIISIDDGCASDIRVAELCERYEVPAVFYWPVEWHSLAYSNGYKPLDYNEATRIASRFEIGSHTITHRHLTKLPLFEAIKEVLGSKFMLQRMFNKDITKFCPPRGYTTPELSEMTLQHYQSQRLTRGPGLVHVHPNSGANDNMHWLEYTKLNPITELWCHSYELDRYNLWEELEGYLRECSRTQF